MTEEPQVTVVAVPMEKGAVPPVPAWAKGKVYVVHEQKVRGVDKYVIRRQTPGTPARDGGSLEDS